MTLRELTAREAAIEASGWGNKVYFWQPRNACLWVYLRVGLEHGEMDEPTEWIDLDGFGLRFWPLGR